jgi:head-tail adaptor
VAAVIGPPGGSRELRSRVVIQRRSATATPLGGTSGTFATFIASRRAKLTPITSRRGTSEYVIAARLQGTSIWDCWLRYDSLTSQIRASDRLCDARQIAADGAFLRVFNIRFAEPLDERRVWMFLQLEQGVAEG